MIRFLGRCVRSQLPRRSGVAPAVALMMLLVAHPDVSVSGISALSAAHAASESPLCVVEKIVPPGSTPLSSFGLSMAYAEDRLIGGLGFAADAWESKGFAHVFLKTPTGWVHEAALKPSFLSVPHYFVTAVAITPNHALLGVPGDNSTGEHKGAGYVFARTGNVWTESAALFALMENGTMNSAGP